MSYILLCIHELLLTCPLIESKLTLKCDAKLAVYTCGISISLFLTLFSFSLISHCKQRIVASLLNPLLGVCDKNSKILYDSQNHNSDIHIAYHDCTELSWLLV